MRLVTLLLAAGLLTGCGLYHWSKAGVDAGAFQRDSTDCQQQSGAPAQPQSGGAAPAGSEANASPWEACMTGKGWHYSNWW